ncbi:hypothetical protein M7775_14105 [Sporomusa sphaeroides DSM 2875]|nr:hypothetical protein [Sporomusa sphaeroides]MCM0759689.1 hypothetical protein [Sporomusa sphaeroides DSM 2875]
MPCLPYTGKQGIAMLCYSRSAMTLASSLILAASVSSLASMRTSRYQIQ